MGRLCFCSKGTYSQQDNIIKTARIQILIAAALAGGSFFGWLTMSNRLAHLARAQDRQAATGQVDRTVLPIAEPKVAPITTLDARDAKAPPRFEVKAPQGAPNVVIVLIDDFGLL